MSKHLRMARLIELLILIKHNPDWGPKKLAEYFEISQKRLHDDLNELNAANIPIVYNGKGYSFLGAPALPPVELNIDEALALWLQVKLLKKHKEDVYTPSVQSASAKLLNMLPRETADMLLELEGKISVESPRTSPEANKMLSIINKALVSAHTLKIEYYSYSSDNITSRKVDPYSVIFRGNSWYLTGYCHLRKEIRTFRLSRIKNIEKTSASFIYPEDFSITDYISKSWAVFQGEETEVEIWFSKKLAPLIEEHNWRPDQEITKNANGSIIFKTRVRGTLEIRRWIMSWGDGVKVIKPESLKKEILKHSAALNKAHS